MSGRFRTNCYLFGDEITNEICIIDPGIDPSLVTEFVEREKLRPICVIGTHGHHDHIQSAFKIMDFFNIPLLIHPNDFRRRTLEKVKYIKENDVVEIGSEKLHIVDTPGHTSGGLMLISYDNQLIFTGDTLLHGKLPRQLVDFDELIASMRKIMSYPKVTDNFEIYPGHGRKSTIGDEKQNNEFNEFNKSED